VVRHGAALGCGGPAQAGDSEKARERACCGPGVGKMLGTPCDPASTPGLEAAARRSARERASTTDGLQDGRRWLAGWPTIGCRIADDGLQDRRRWGARWPTMGCIMARAWGAPTFARARCLGDFDGRSRPFFVAGDPRPGVDAGHRRRQVFRAPSNPRCREPRLRGFSLRVASAEQRVGARVSADAEEQTRPSGGRVPGIVVGSYSSPIRTLRNRHSAVWPWADSLRNTTQGVTP